MKKVFWYINRLALLCVVCFRLLIYSLTHSKEIMKLLFSFYLTVNEFYQVSHGKSRNFQKTEMYKRLVKKKIFAESNVFNTDSNVARGIEIQALSGLVCGVAPKTIFEIGTYHGFTTLHFAVNSPGDCQIYTLDLPLSHKNEQKEKMHEFSYDDMYIIELNMNNNGNRIYHNHPQAFKIKELYGDSMRFDFSPYYGKIDFIYIDGNHSYPFVKSDTEKALKMLSKNGTIVWHDFDYIIHRDVFEYLNDFSKTYEIYSIPNTRFAIYGKNLV